MENNRPQGRKKHISGQGTGLDRRGEGLNTGPVGSGSTAPKKPSDGGVQIHETGSGGGGNYRGTRGSGGGKAIFIIIAIVVIYVLFFRNGGQSSLPGGGESLTQQDPGTAQSYTEPTPKPSATIQAPGGTSGISASAYQGLIGSSSQSDWKEPANIGTLNSSVASGARAKRTEILGGGRDTVTIMVYMCGTDLESQGGMATKDLIEMTRATIGSNVNLIVYTGGCTRWNNNVVSASRNQIYQIVGGSMKLLENGGSACMTDPDTLAYFIGFCAERFPANRYELIFWDHGGGSVSGYGYDQKFQSRGSMSLAGIQTALGKAGVSFDFIGFDACLMATVETGLMLDRYADYLIASEETEPGTGWYYTNWLTKLSADTSMPTVEIGKCIVDDFVSVCERSAGNQSATLSVVDLAELSFTVPGALRDFSKSLSGMIADNEYKQISVARSNTREFARSTQIDQIDLVHFAENVGNAEGKALSKAVRGAVKYNRTSSNMNNSYGLSIYFPYRKMSVVDKAVKTYDAIGMDDSYSQAIREFASLETGGQAASGGYNSAFSSLFGDYSSYAGSYGSSYGSSSSSSYDSQDLIGSLIGAFLGGDFGSFYGDGSGSSGYSGYYGRALGQGEAEAYAGYIADNLFDPANLVWTSNYAGEQVIALGEDQWSLVTGLDLNMFYDDGQGYIDLGLDNAFEFDENGDLLAPTELTWLAINGQIAAYYHDYDTGSGDSLVITGHVPVLYNGVPAELLISFDSDYNGSVVGLRYTYPDGETDTVAKSQVAPAGEADLNDSSAESGETEILIPRKGDRLEFVFDYYSYDGEYINSFVFGGTMIVGDELEVSDAYLPAGRVLTTYRFTDIYQQHYWSLPLEQ